MFNPSLPRDQEYEPSGEPADLQDLLRTQLQIAEAMQKIILRDQASLSPRDLKDLAAGASSLIALSHRTEQTLKEISTYRTVLGVILEFLRRRNDSLGEDLLGELHTVAAELKATADLQAVKHWVPSQG
jgi:hypothetical protein